MWYKVKKIYQWSNLVRPKWKPWANTIAYYPLKENTNDYSWNSRNLTNNWLTFWTYSGVTCASSSGNYAQLSLWTATTYSNLTMSIWYNATTTTPVREAFCFGGGGGNLDIWNNGVTYYASSSQHFDQTTWVTANQWTNIIVTVNWSTWNIYKNWSLYTTKTNWWNVVANSIAIWTNSDASYPQNNRFYGYLSNAIIENKTRTAQEVSDYYNLTKWNYWL